MITIRKIKPDPYLNKFIKYCENKFENNLAAILIFGTYNTGPFVKGVSDVDTIILFKQQNDLDFKKEQAELRNKFISINLSILHFRTIIVGLHGSQ